MIRKLHIQMALFSTFITSTILVIMAAACLLIAENGTKENSYTTFTDNTRSCITHLEEQSMISHQWLMQVKNNYGFSMEIRDNGNPLFFNKLNFSQDVASLFRQAEQISKDTYGLDLTHLQSVSILTKTAIFQMEHAYAATALIPHTSGVLSVIILYPLDKLNHQLLYQRLAFGGIVALAIVALTLFSWFFTRKMLLPLQESRKKQTEFIASASHELRSPLAVNQASLSAMETAPPEEFDHFSSMIRTESNRMSRLINDMLSLANADNHSWKLLLSNCELDTLLLDVYEKYETLAAKKQLSLEIRLPDDPVAPCRLDAFRISQVLAILLDNAFSYVPAHGKIILSLEQKERQILLYVSDNGPGIPDEAKEAVFERFYRQDTSRKEKQHFGLGLCIAKEIMQLHHGSIHIEDTPGGGATFVLTFPYVSKA